MKTSLFSGLTNWPKLTDYRIQSKNVYFGILISQSLVAYLLFIAEITVDLQSSGMETFAGYALLVTAITILGVRYPKSDIVRTAVPVFMYVLCEYIFLALPRTYAFMVYWFPLVPAVALIIQGLKRSQAWALIILVTQFGNFFYLKNQLGETYSLEVRGLSSVWSGAIFVVTFLSALYFLYTLLGNAYAKTKAKNEELNLLKSQIQEMNQELSEMNSKLTISNESLEEKVRFRTKELVTQNSQLKKYSYANSHLLRAPLSNIMGLVSLINQKATASEDKEIVFALSCAAQELDQVVKKINTDLESGGLSEPKFRR